MPSLKPTRYPNIRVYSGPRGKTYHVQIRRNGETFSRKFSILNDARSWLTQANASLDRGEHPDPKPGTAKHHTLAAEIDIYLSNSVVTKPTEDNYRHLKWWRNRLGTLKLSDVTRGRVIEARDELLSGRTPSTVNRYLQSLSGVLSYAEQCERLDKRFQFSGRGAHAVKLAEPRGRVRFLDADEQARLLDACKAENSTLHALVVVALSTGARAGELRDLEWRDVDLKAGYAIARETKNGEDRRLYLAEKALDELRTLQKVRSLHDPRVFGGYAYRRPWANVLEAAEIENFRFHDLRHTAASNLAMNGATLADIAEVLGHKTLSMVQRYAHLSESHVSDVVARMNAKVFGST